MLLAAALVIPALVLRDQGGSEGLRGLGTALNWISWIAFLVELGAMLAVSPRPGAWAREHPLRILVIVGSLPLFPLALAWLRLFRLFRILELLHLLPGVRSSLRGDGVRYPALLALFIIVLGGLGLTLVETGQDLSSGDGLWWSVQTVTTVGYGDIVPETDTGRLVGAVVMLTGIALVGYVMAHGADRVMSDARRQPSPVPKDPEIARTLEEVTASLDQLGQRLGSIEKRLDDRNRPPPP